MIRFGVLDLEIGQLDELRDLLELAVSIKLVVTLNPVEHLGQMNVEVILLVIRFCLSHPHTYGLERL